MRKPVNCCFVLYMYNAKNLPVSDCGLRRLCFEGSDISVTQTKVSLQTTDLATQIFKIKGEYECVV